MALVQGGERRFFGHSAGPGTYLNVVGEYSGHYRIVGVATAQGEAREQH